MSEEASQHETVAAPRRRPPRVGRSLLWAAIAVVAVASGLGLWTRAQLTGSLPKLDGEVRLPGLHSAVVVERDGLGVPTIRGQRRVDVARALGFVHAQERFFQMDLLRRKAAGELSELVGAAALPLDRASRRHRLRAVADAVVAGAAEQDQAIGQAYAEGVNAGLAALSRPPFEYLLLGTEPAAWEVQDTVLAVQAMFLELHDENAALDATLGVMRETLAPEMFEFLAPLGTEWDAPIVGDAFVAPPIPGPEVMDLRGGTVSATTRTAPRPADARLTSDLGASLLPATWLQPAPPEGGDVVAGSNNWAVAGSHTKTGAALVADDMHLPLGLPNIWYRASLVWPAARGERRVTGVTLPGVPAVVAGSNGMVAWGFTNSQGDWSDLVVVEVDPHDPRSYRTPEGPRPFVRHNERIRVKDVGDETLEIRSTIWGPVIGEDAGGRPLAVRWTAHEPEAVHLGLGAMEEVADLDAALEAAAHGGIPPQNIVAADATGRIGWTIMGRIPRRVGFDGRWPVSWADGTNRWEGWLSPNEQPRVTEPAEGRIWSANARVVDGDDMRAIGLGHFVLGARAQQIRDDLLALEEATAEDMLRVQLDDRAVFLGRWQALLLELLGTVSDHNSPRRAEVETFVERWGGRASIDSVGYRIVRAFRLQVASRVFAPLVAACHARDPGFDYAGVFQQEGPLWRLVSERPAHLLDPRYATWEEALLSDLDTVIEDLIEEGLSVPALTWGRRNVVSLRHPLSRALPPLAGWLDVPPRPLPGDSNMPRVQTPTHGASERFAVSPGRESEGLFHMPGGQSGHPLSPFYRAGHDAWADGQARAFLPGPTRHTLRLVPGS